MSALHYVYEHWRPDRDECFYVGKGKGKRANVLYGRNFIHMAIQKKLALLSLCVEVKVVATGLTSEEALALEIERIAFWRADGADLANLTAGGEGSTDPSPSTREKMRAAKVGRKLTEEHKRKISESTKAALSTPEMKARLSEAAKAHARTPESRARMSKFQKERPRSREQYEKTAEALRGRKLSPEHIEKMRRGNVGRKQSPETVAKRNAVNTGKKRSAEFCARMKAAWTPERRAEQTARSKALWTLEFTEAARQRVMDAPKDDKGRMMSKTKVEDK